MHMLERSITKEYWTNSYRQLARCLPRATRIPHTAIYKMVVSSTQSATITAYVKTFRHHSEIRPLAWLYLKKKAGWIGNEVTHVYVPPSCRGQGLAARLYSAALHDGMLVVSGLTHTSSSRRLWEKMIMANRYDIYATDLKTNQAAQVWWEEDAIECSLPLYHTHDWMHDVRLVASLRN